MVFSKKWLIVRAVNRVSQYTIPLSPPRGLTKTHLLSMWPRQCRPLFGPHPARAFFQVILPPPASTIPTRYRAESLNPYPTMPSPENDDSGASGDLCGALQRKLSVELTVLFNRTIQNCGTGLSVASQEDSYVAVPKGWFNIFTMRRFRES